MASIRVKFEDGVFIPLDDVSDVQPGQRHTIEIVDPEAQAADLAQLRATLAEVRARRQPLPPASEEKRAAIKANLAETAGSLIDDDFDIEQFYEDRDAEQLEETQRRWHSSL